MSAFDNTVLNAVIDQKWDHDLDDARYAKAVIYQNVFNKSALVKQSGQLVNLTYKNRYSVATVATDGTFVPATFTPSSVQVNVNQWKTVAIEITDRAAAQAFWTPDHSFPKDAGATLGEDLDTSLGALYSGITTNIVGDATNGAKFDDTIILASILKLDSTNIPLKPRVFIVPPVGLYGGLFTLDRFTNANQLGVDKSVVISGSRYNLFGHPVLESNLLTTVGGVTKGLLIHESTFAAVVQLKNEWRRAERTAALVFSYVMAVQTLYGVQTFRENHGCLLNIRSTLT